METKDILKKIIFLYRAVGRLSARHFEPLGLTPIQGGLIGYLSRHSKISQADLSRLAGSDPAATGKAIDSLIKNGWVVKHEHPTDRRRWIISLSPKGKKAGSKVTKYFVNVSKEILSPLNQRESKVLLSLLDKIINKL